MKRVLLVLAVLALGAGWTLGSQTGGASDAARFAPASVVATAPANYPINSVAEGTVVLEVGVASDGSVGDIRIVRDVPSLTTEAMKAVRKWKFSAATLDGRATRSTVIVAFAFSRPVLF